MTGRIPFLLLALLATALCAVIALEIDAAAPPDNPTGIVAIRHAPIARPRVAVQADATDHTEAWVATILARPLFSRDRRPTPPRAVSGGEATITALPRLTGVLVSATERKAIFAASQGSKAVVAGLGTALGPYTVEAIAPGLVTVSGPQGTVQMHPSFDADARKALLAPMPQQQQQAAAGQPPPPGQPPQPPVINMRPGSQFQRALQAIQAARPNQQNPEVDK